MTGFGAAEGETAHGLLRVELRTVNHRFLNVALKVPAELLPLEATMRELLRQHFDRGHVAVQARWLGGDDAATSLRVDLVQAQRVAACLRELQGALELGGELDLALIARQPDVLVRSTSASAAPEWHEVEPIVLAAIEACKAMRLREGAALAADLRQRLENLAAAAERVAALAPGRLVRERDRLRASVRQLLDGHAMDDARVAQELAMAADRLDVTEELVRLRTHIAACRATLDGESAVGKQLGFLAQELGREVNTIGSKANDAEMAQLVVAMKGELEKVREQLENLE